MPKRHKSIHRPPKTGGQRGKLVKQELTSQPRAKPVSLRPLSFEEAVAGLAAVNPREPSSIVRDVRKR